MSITAKACAEMNGQVAYVCIDQFCFTPEAGVEELGDMGRRLPDLSRDCVFGKSDIPQLVTCEYQWNVHARINLWNWMECKNIMNFRDLMVAAFYIGTRQTANLPDQEKWSALGAEGVLKWASYAASANRVGSMYRQALDLSSGSIVNDAVKTACANKSVWDEIGLSHDQLPKPLQVDWITKQNISIFENAASTICEE